MFYMSGMICHLLVVFERASNDLRSITLQLLDTISSKIFSLTFARYGRFDHEHWCTHKVNTLLN